MKTKALILIFTMSLLAVKVAGQCDVTKAVNGPAAVCTGTSTNITVALSESGSSYQLRIGTTNVTGSSPVIGDGGTISLPTGNLTSTTTFNVLVSNSGAACSAQLTQTATVTVDPATVEGSVTGGTTICSGSTSALLTLGSYTGSIVRWESSPNGTSSWSTISNTAATYTSGALTSTTYFRAVVKSGVCSEANSTSTTVTVNPSLPASVSIVAVPSGAICAGTSVTFTATPVNEGTLPTYKWFNGASEIFGETGTTYTSNTLNNGEIITAQLTSNASPCLTGSPATSNLITMTVNPILTASVSIGASTNPSCAGSPVTFTAVPTNEGSSPAYQWKVNTVNAGTNSNTFTYTPVTGDIVNVVLTSNATPCLSSPTAISSDINMTVNALPIPTLSSNATGNKICAGGSVTFTAGGAGGGTYQFFKNGVSQGAPSVTNTYTTTTLTDGQTVTVTVVDGNNCTATHSGISTTVYAYPAITAMTESGASGEPYSIVPVDGTNGTVPSGTTYSWVTASFSGDLNIVSGATGTDQSSISGTITNSKSTSRKGNFTVTPKNVQCTGSVFNLEMTIFPKAFISDKTTSICNGGTFTVSPVDGDGTDIVPAGTTYSWTLPVAPGISGLAAGPAGSVNISGTLTNSTTSPINVVYSVKPKSGTVTGANFNVTVTVRPTATVNQPSNQIRCSGQATTAIIFGGVANSYTWTNNNTSIGLAASGTTDISSFTATNTGIVPVTSTIIVTPYYDGCPGSTKTFTITVNPLPTLSGVLQDAPICSGSAAQINLSGLLPGSISTVAYKIGLDVQTPVAGIDASGTPPFFLTPTLAASNNGKTLQITGITIPATGCSVTTFINSTVLIVNSATIPTISGDPVECVGSTLNNYFTETGMTGYTWLVPTGGTITGGTGTNSIDVTWNTVGSPHTVTVNYTNSNLCTAASPTVKNITVIPLPTPTITGPASVCINSTGNIYVTEPGMATYTWTITGGTITSGSTAPGSNQAIVTWTSSGARSISVTCTNSSGCAASAPFVYNVTVNPLPVPSFLTGPSVARITSTGNFYSTEAGMNNYVWNVSGGGTITAGGTSGSSSVTVTWNTVGSKTVSVSYTNNPNGCTAAAPTVYNVTVNPLPSVSAVQIDPGTPAIGYMLTGSYSYTDGGGGGNVSTVRWLRNGITPIGGAIFSSYIVQAADLNNTLTFEVTPVSTVGPPTTGTIVKSSATVPVEDLSEIPVADQVCIEGVRSAGSILKGKYRYTHSKPEGASTYQWYSNTVAIPSATGTQYTLLAGDINANQSITFKVTPVSSNITPLTGMTVESNPMANIPVWPIDYSVSGTSVLLTASPAGGIFSGPGVTNGKFSPSSVGIGTYNIQYQLTIVNSATTCSQQVTKSVNVITNVVEFTDFKPVYCNDEVPSVINVTGVPVGATANLFECTDPDAIVSQTTTEVTIDPQKMSPGNTDILTFSYKDVLGNSYSITKSFVIDKVGTNLQVLNLDPEYCADAPKAAITITGATPAGGTAAWTGTVLSDLTSTTATVDAALGTPGQTYPLTYQYTTPLGCKSAILTRSVKINPLPNTIFVLNPFYNYDGPEVDLIPVQSPGTFSGNGVVSNSKLLPLQAGLGEHTINYYIKDVNGCDDSRNIKTTIKKAQGNITGIPAVICYQDITYNVDVTGLPAGYSVNSFVNSRNSIIHTTGSTTATYNVPAAGEGLDTLTFSYKLDAVDYWISTIVNIDSLGLVDFTNLFPGDKICDNIAPFKLNATPTGGVFSGPVAGNFLDPVQTAGSYGVTYVYTNQKTACAISKTIPIEIIKAPVVSFTPKDVCIESVNDITYFANKTKSTDKVISWLWTFAEIGAAPDTVRESGYLYRTGGIHSLSLIAATISGCSVKKDSSINLGTRPAGNFTWQNDCYAAGTNLKLFDATVTDLTISSRTWDFNNGSFTSSDLNPEYPMSDTGIVRVKYIVKTNYANCADTVLKNIYLRPTFKLAPDVYYSENFETGKNGWGKDESDLRTSWQFGKPNGKVINSAYSGTGAWFTSYDTLSPKPKESSSVISPCFDFTDIQRPMISIEAIKRFEKNRNGAALQYFAEGDTAWRYVGTLDDGIEWYNSTLISGEPGGEKIGWTTLGDVGEKEYVQSSHSLDELQGRKNVKFRIAYGSDGSNAVGEGIAFDDVRIGERSRKVLLEHFTNTGSKSASEATKIVDDIITRRMNDVINIQYHTNFPDNDLFYAASQGDASARIFSYGLSRVPYSMIDGGNELLYASLADYKSPLTDLDTNDLSRRSLLDTRFTISVDGNEATGSGVLTVKSKITSTVSGNYDNLILYLVVTEKKNSSTETGAMGEKTFYNVFRKFVPDAGGIELKKSWTKGEAVVIPDQTWAIPGNLSKSDIEVIAFIQDSRTKEVYQVNSDLMTTAKSGFSNSPNEAVEGSEDLSRETATSFGLYPNPADERLTIEFNNRLAADAEVRIFDLQGVIKETYKVASGESGLFIEDLSLKAGIYFVRVTAGGVDLGFKKLIVTGE